MSTSPNLQKPNHLPWIMAGVVGCLGLCLCITIVGGGLYVIAGTRQAPSTTGNLRTPTILSRQGVPPGTAAASGNIVTGAVMAKDTQGDTYDPVGITDSFTADQSVYHEVVTISGAPSGTRLKVVWLTGSGEEMGEYEITAEGSRNVDFTYEPEGGNLPVGSYQSILFLNGILNRTLNFSVK
jgi:hypothetical protein